MTLPAGHHQIVVEYFVDSGYAELSLVVTDTDIGADASSSFVHDPAGPCNANCAPGGCKTAQQYCEQCTDPTLTPVGGVCTSPLSA